MRKIETVFKFNIWFMDKDGVVNYDYAPQERLVVAETEEIAEMKLNEYREELKQNGCCDFIYSYQYIAIENVII